MHARAVLLSRLRKAAQKSQRCLDLLRDIERGVPESDLWQIQKPNPLIPNPSGLLRHDLQAPSKTLRLVTEVINDYIQAIESFTDEQWAAFSLGLSAAWLPLGLMCRRLMAEQIKCVQESLADYRSREARLSSAELRNFQKEDPFFSRLPFASPEQCLPSQILGDYLELLREQELALSAIRRAGPQYH